MVGKKGAKWRKCPSCGARLRPLRYYVNSKEERGWVKVGYYCPVEKKFFHLEEIEGEKNED